MHIYENPEEAKEKGKIARKFMEDNFSLESMGEQLDGHFIRIMESEKFKSRRYEINDFCFRFLFSFFSFVLLYFQFNLKGIIFSFLRVDFNVSFIALFVMIYLIYIANIRNLNYIIVFCKCYYSEYQYNHCNMFYYILMTLKRSNQNILFVSSTV